MVTVSSLFVGLRFFVRLKLRIIGAEDHFILLAWCCAMIPAAMFQYTLIATMEAASTGSLPDIAKLLPYEVAEAALLYICGFCAKASVALLLLRLIGKTSRRLRILIIGSLILYSVSTVLVVVSAIVPACDPELNTQQTPPTRTCMANGVAWVSFIQTWNICSALLDILYSVVATRIIYKLQVSKQKKVGLTIVLSLGWITALLAMWRFVGAWVYTAQQKLVLNIIGATLEANLVIICASLPTLGPLFEYFKSGKPLTPRGSAASKTPYSNEPAQDRGRLRVMTSGTGAQSRVRDRSREELLTPVERDAANKGLPEETVVVEMKACITRPGSWDTPV